MSESPKINEIQATTPPEPITQTDNNLTAYRKNLYNRMKPILDAKKANGTLKKRTYSKAARIKRNPNEYKGLTLSDRKLLEYLCLPDAKFESVNQICANVGIERSTYYAAFNNQAFRDLLKKRSIDLYVKAAPKIAKVAEERALNGDPKWAAILLELADYKTAQPANVVNIAQPVNLPADLQTALEQAVNKLQALTAKVQATHAIHPDAQTTGQADDDNRLTSPTQGSAGILGGIAKDKVE